MTFLKKGQKVILDSSLTGDPAIHYSKVAVALVTAGVLGMSLYGNYFLEHEFDPLHFLPKDSYLMRFINTRNR